MGGGLGGRGQREEKWDNCNSLNNKIFKCCLLKKKERKKERKDHNHSGLLAWPWAAEAKRLTWIAVLHRELRWPIFK